MQLWGSHHLSWMEQDFWGELHPLAGSPGGTLVELYFGLSLGLLQGRVNICLHIYRERVPIKHSSHPDTCKALAVPALCLCIHISTLFGSKLQTPSLNTSVCLSVGKVILLTTNHLRKINSNRRGRDLGLMGHQYSFTV